MLRQVKMTAEPRLCKQCLDNWEIRIVKISSEVVKMQHIQWTIIGDFVYLRNLEYGCNLLKEIKVWDIYLSCLKYAGCLFIFKILDLSSAFIQKPMDLDIDNFVKTFIVCLENPCSISFLRLLSWVDNFPPKRWFGNPNIFFCT